MGVLMQAFYWDCPREEQQEFTWWNFVATKLDELRNAGITALWLPPAGKGANCGGMSMGYDVYDYYDLGEFAQKSVKPGEKRTWFGAKNELKALTKAIHDRRMKVYADLVLNHNNGADGEEFNPILQQKRWTKFAPQSNIFTRDWTCFNPSPYMELDDVAFGDMPDLCHINPRVSTGILNHAKWMIQEIGFDGFRYDFVKGFGAWIVRAIHDRKYTRDKVTVNLFGVGECWAGDDFIDSWLDSVNRWADNRVGAFDFPLRFRAALRPGFYQSVVDVLHAARSNAYRTVNFIMVEAYWNIGRMIVEEEQQGRGRAEYGKGLLKNLAARLTVDFGEPFSERNLRHFRQFYTCFPIWNALCSELEKYQDIASPSDSPSKIRSALRSELTWSHYRLLIRVEKPEARKWYMNEAADQYWSTRSLEHQINSLYYERLLMSRDKSPVIEEMQAKTAPLAATPRDFIKDPYVLEFLGLQDNPGFREAELETAIIGKLQAFMLELGKGFAFVARQQRISTETKDFYVDLVFYNYILKCFVLIDLKSGELTHQDIGQMDMYVRLYEDTIKGPDDNPTVGIILCTEKDQTVVKYSVLNESSQLFASKYRLYLPSEEELRAEVEREREMVVRERLERYGVGENS